MRKIFFCIATLCLITSCAGPNPNPKERTTDIAWVSENYGKAFSTAKPFADAGQPWAQLRIGIFYENGWGVEQSIEEAEKWYKKASIQTAEGEWANGKMIGAMGKPGYFNQNSDALIAQYDLASLYSRRNNSPSDLIEAYVLINGVLNKSNGSDVFFCCEFDGGRYFDQKMFLDLKEEIESKMNSDQKEQAKRLLEEKNITSQ